MYFDYADLIATFILKIPSSPASGSNVVGNYKTFCLLLLLVLRRSVLHSSASTSYLGHVYRVTTNRFETDELM